MWLHNGAMILHCIIIRGAMRDVEPSYIDDMHTHYKYRNISEWSHDIGAIAVVESCRKCVVPFWFLPGLFLLFLAAGTPTLLHTLSF